MELQPGAFASNESTNDREVDSEMWVLA